MGNDYAAHQKTQKQLGQEFKLRPMMTKGRDFKQSEVEWAKRYGYDIFKLREEITKDFNTSKSGQEFKAKLEAQGIVLCRGDKSQFVLILPWSQHKALSSMVHGRPPKAVLRRALGDIDISKLPTIEEGKARVKAMLPKAKPRAKGKSDHTLYIRSRSTHAASWKFAGLLTTSPQPKTVAAPTMATIVKGADSRSAPVPQPAMPLQERNGNEHRFTPHREDIGGIEMPPSRADLAYKEEFDKWTGLIDVAANDQSVPKEQRLANVAILRDRQKAAAKAARKRVRNEERSAARAVRRARKIFLGVQAPPSR